MNDNGIDTRARDGWCLGRIYPGACRGDGDANVWADVRRPVLLCSWLEDWRWLLVTDDGRIVAEDVEPRDKGKDGNCRQASDGGEQLSPSPPCTAALQMGPHGVCSVSAIFDSCRVWRSLDMPDQFLLILLSIGLGAMSLGKEESVHRRKIE